MMMVRIFLMATLCGILSLDAYAQDGAPVDLSQTEDLFTQPLKPNPLLADPERVAIRVNGEEIKQGDIIERVEMALERFGDQIPPDQLEKAEEQLFQQAKNSIINERLILAEIKTEGITISDERIDEEIAKIKTSLPEDTTLEALLDADGLSQADLRADLSNELATQSLFDLQLASLKEIDEEEVKAFPTATARHRSMAARVLCTRTKTRVPEPGFGFRNPSASSVDYGCLSKPYIFGIPQQHVLVRNVSSDHIHMLCGIAYVRRIS